MDTKWYIFLIAGPLFFAMYYYTYSFIIRKFNVFTVGRRETDFVDEELVENTAVVQADKDVEMAKQIIEGLGGAANIVDVDNCISRLRVELKDDSLVDEALIKKSQPAGIVRPGKNVIHIVYGGRITKVRNVVDNYLFALKG
jgi:PTS system maltose and glucose-specific IIC component